MNCLDCFHFKLSKRKTQKYPTLYCTMGLQRGNKNHEKKFVLTEDECREDGYYIIDQPEFCRAVICPLFEDMDD